jgi:succinoglycan biosynthesis transport protein ExoP
MTDANFDRDEGRHGHRALVSLGQTLPASRSAYGPLGYPLSLGDVPEFTPNNPFLECWRVLVKRKWLILGIAATFFFVGTVRTLMQTPLYSSTVRLQIDRDVAKIVENGNITPAEFSDNQFMSTQFQLLQSRTMAERVASVLKLSEDEDFFKPREFSVLDALKSVFKGSPEGDQSPNKITRGRVAAGIILANRSVAAVANSRLVDITYSDPVPARAQRIANSFADAFVAANLDKRFQANAAAKIFLEDKIQQLKLRLEDSDKKLLDFAQEQQILDVNTSSSDVTNKASIAENDLGAATAALGALTAERTKNEQLWRQAEDATGINLPQLLSNDVIVQLRKQRNDLEVNYQEKLQTYKPSYPAMVQIKNQIDEIDRQVETEVRALKDSLRAAYETSLAQENEMKSRIEALKQDVLDLQKRSIQYNILKREVDTNRELYASLLQRYKEVDVASGVAANNVFVVDRGLLPGSPSSPHLLQALLMSLLLGAVIGFGSAYMLERFDDKISSAEQVEVISGLSTLGAIPNVANVEHQLQDPRSELCEAYRSLCTALQFSTDNGLPKSLTVTSTGPAEGKSLTSLTIAKHFATLGRRVLLVDADLRNPSLHVKLKTDNNVGLTNYLTGACSPPEVMQKTPISTLAFMASGPLPPNAADLLGSPRVHSLLSVGAEVFDLIIIDSPPVMGLADAQLLSSAVSGTVFVVAAGVARLSGVRGALRRIQLSRGIVLGSVLTKYDFKTSGYGYGYGYGYGGAKTRHSSEEWDVHLVPQLADHRGSTMRESA